jgi:hypothetical protein
MLGLIDDEGRRLREQRIEALTLDAPRQLARLHAARDEDRTYQTIKLLDITERAPRRAMDARPSARD